jgi:hypothetical protein
MNPSQEEIELQIRQLSALDVVVRQSAARRLAEIGTGGALYALNYRKIFEKDPTTREVVREAIQRLETRLSRLPIEFSLPGILAAIRPILSTERPDPTARAAALRVLAFVEQQSAKKPSQEPALPALPAIVGSFPTEIPAVIQALEDPRPEWQRRAEGTLFLRGGEAIGPLRAAFPRASPLHKARIAGVLAGIGDIEALLTLWTAWREGLEGEAKVSLKTALLRMGAQLPSRYNRVSLEDQLTLLNESREHLPAMAEFVARALKQRAMEKPIPSLRRALPLLRGSWLHSFPRTFEEARQAIEKATENWADLPIAADSPEQPLDNLPRPMEVATDSIDATNLPKASEVSQ